MCIRDRYGELKGMALPLLTFPFGLLGSLSVLLMQVLFTTMTNVNLSLIHI